MKSPQITFVFLLFSTVLAAQEPLSANGDNYFFLGFTLPITKVRDQAHSPQLYQGWTPTVSLGYQSVGKDVVTRSGFSYTFSFPGLSPKTRPKPERQLSSANMNTIQASVAVYKRVGDYDTEGWNRYAGGVLTFTFDTRVYDLPSNNLFGYQCNTSLNLGAFVQKKLDNKWRFNYEAFTPLLSYALRPNHIGMPPLTSGNFSGGMKRILTSGKVVTINKLFRFYNKFSVEKQINDHRQRQFSYTWDAVVNRVGQPLNSVMGGLGQASLFKM
jgi:RNAse (barnase) inhibitor barstar